MARKILRVLTVVAALFASVAAAAAMPAGVTSLPAAFRGHEVYLRVSLNGAAPVWMTFDIGAYESSVAAPYVDGASRMTLKLGTVVLPGVYFHLARQPFGIAPDGSAIAGRLGQDWLGNRMVEVRFREHEVWLSAPIGAPAAVTVAAR